jgi:glycosyltransferase involved in cell wall biosynthesis
MDVELTVHILFFSDNFPPEVNAPASRTFEHCREWVKAGHTVTVVTCAPNFPKGKVFGGYRNRLWQSEDMEGIRVIRVWSYMTANTGFTRRILDYLSFMASGVIAGLLVRGVDIIVGTSPQFFTTCAACIVGGAKRVPWIFELRDFWPESIKAVGAIHNLYVIRCLERLEMVLYRRAKRIVAVTHSFKRTLIERGISADKIDVVTNGVDLSAFELQTKDAELVGELELENKFVAGYIGTHGMAHALETLLDAAAILKQTPGAEAVRILFLGDGARKARLVAAAEARKLDNVLFLDTVPKAQVARYWSLLDTSIIHLRNVELFGTVIPSKLFECMGMGIPVLHGVSGESADIVRREQVGEVFESENAQELADGILRMRAQPDRHEAYRQNALKTARLYDRKHLAVRMLQIMEETCLQASYAVIRRTAP